MHKGNILLQKLILPSNKGDSHRGEKLGMLQAKGLNPVCGNQTSYPKTKTKAKKKTTTKNQKPKTKPYLSLKKRSVLALQAKLQVLFPYASCTLNSSSGSFQPFVGEQRETMNISCVAFAYLQVPWKLLKCKRNNVIIYLSSSTCSLHRKEYLHSHPKPVQTRCPIH